MLLSFSVSNFKSFREEQVLDLMASPLKPAFSWLENAAVPVGKEESALRVKALYGANASGKSNLIKALQNMLTVGLNSARQPVLEVNIDGFGFDKENLNSPSEFEVEFVVSEKHFRYGFKVDKLKFHEEWLFDETVRKAKVFTRIGQQVSINKKYFDRPENVQLLLEGDNEIFREDASILSALSLFNEGGAVGQTIAFLSGILVLRDTDDVDVEQGAYAMLINKGIESKVKSLLEHADIEIDELWVFDKKALKDSQAPDDLVRAVNGSRGPLALMAAYSVSEEQKNYLSWLTEQGESQGTQKLLIMAPYIVQTIQQGQVLIIDEFEAKLHTRLSREIVAMFNSTSGNPNNAQFIFSTHDTNLLDHRLLRRDQIDFVEKGKDRASTIYSLADVKGIRKEADFERDYLGGSYGAVPEVTDFNIAIFED